MNNVNWIAIVVPYFSLLQMMECMFPIKCAQSKNFETSILVVMIKMKTFLRKTRHNIVWIYAYNSFVCDERFICLYNECSVALVHQFHSLCVHWKVMPFISLNYSCYRLIYWLRNACHCGGIWYYSDLHHKFQNTMAVVKWIIVEL